jgi:CHAT domain-containing protein
VFDAGAPVPAAPDRPTPQLRSVLGNHFEPLSGTAAEAQSIKRMIPDAEILTGSRATESAIKSVRFPRVLHVATHGFFLQDQDLSAATGPGAAAALEDPMLRSGLVFAGANTGRSGSDDGVLTALEAAALGLSGTQLVVLSACETGVGDVRTGEGVFGLRRAFMVAGAETLVMSLWQVDDQATERLMTEFYGRLTKGEGRAEALRQASLALLRDPARRHPFFWASFIAAGEAGRMRP